MSLCPCSLATSWNGSRQPEAGVDPALGFSLHPGWCVSGRTPRLHWQSRGSAAAFPFCQPGLSSLLSCPRRTRDHSCGEWAEGMEGRCCGCPSRLLGGLPRAPAPCVMGTGFHLPCTVELAHGGVDHVTPSSGLGLPRSASARVPSEATAQTETSFWKRYSSASAPVSALRLLPEPARHPTSICGATWQMARAALKCFTTSAISTGHVCSHPFRPFPAAGAHTGPRSLVSRPS